MTFGEKLEMVMLAAPGLAFLFLGVTVGVGIGASIVWWLS